MKILKGYGVCQRASNRQLIAFLFDTFYTLGPSTDFEDENAEATGPADVADSEAEALERLARAGQWERCLAHAGSKAPHYALRYATYLFRTHPVSKNNSDH